MKITVIAMNDIKPAAINVRLHPQKQINELKRSVTMFGQTRAIVVDENHSILAGNGLYTALSELGYQAAECYVMEGLSEKQKKKLMLADNRVYELGLMDMDVFDRMIAEMDGDTDIPGWDEELLKTLLSTAPEVDDMISDYGVFEEKKVESINSRRRDDYADPPEAAQYEPPAQPHQVQAPPPEPEAEPVRRYIICPKCGEKICL